MPERFRLNPARRVVMWIKSLPFLILINDVFIYARRLFTMQSMEERFTAACEKGEIPGVALLVRDQSGKSSHPLPLSSPIQFLKRSLTSWPDRHTRLCQGIRHQVHQRPHVPSTDGARHGRTAGERDQDRDDRRGDAMCGSRSHRAGR